VGHHIDNTRSIFNNVRYQVKTTAEIIPAMTHKIDALETLMADRHTRLKKIRDAYHISPEHLANLVLQFQNNTSGQVSFEIQGDGTSQLIPAGVIANIVSEKEMSASEREQIRKIGLILRNIRDVEPYYHPRTGELIERPSLHKLTDFELEYLGF